MPDTTALENALADRAAHMVRAHLEAIRLPIAAEIQSYPSPIAGCDQQFNHLLERRAAVAREIARLDEVVRTGAALGDPIGALEAFVASSDYFDDEKARAILAEWEKA